jgi:hypothetical protein
MMSDDVNPLATRVVAALAGAHPEFAANSRPLGDGDVELFIEAGEDSNAGALVVSTTRGEAIWVRFAPPYMLYCVEDEAELSSIVDALLEDRVLFVRIVGRDGEWAGTTLMDRGGQVDLEPGEKATALSWSGRVDREFVSDTPGTSWVEFHDSELLAVESVDADVEVRLDAYVHAWDDRVQPPRGTGFMQRVGIRLTDSHAPIADRLPVTLDGGAIVIGETNQQTEETHREVVPLPFTTARSAMLRLELVTGQIVEIVGATVTVSAAGPARYVEDLPADMWPGGVQR